MGLQLPVDGVLGRETRSAIRTFQERNGLPVDGVVGPDTERALSSASSGGEQAGQAPSDAGSADTGGADTGGADTGGPEAGTSEPSDSEPSASEPTASSEPSDSEPGATEPTDSEPGASDTGAEQEEEFSLTDLPAAILKPLSSGLEGVAVKIAVAFGYRDEDKLTNLVFYARHPERGGQKIMKGEPNFSQLSREWLDIRERIVRPALSAGPSAPTTPTPTPVTTRDGCRYGFVPTAVETPGGGRIQNKQAPASSSLVQVQGRYNAIPLHPLAAQAWKALVSAARADGLAAPLLLPTSGFRSPETQKRLWEEALEKYGSPEKARKWVAPPGSSPHQTGRAIDFYLGDKNSSGNVANLQRLPAYKWLVQNAVCFGFYPYQAEPWHWEYNPPATS
jgi:LAS superfamily LD-carboxypeptidase LdcB